MDPEWEAMFGDDNPVGDSGGDRARPWVLPAEDVYAEPYPDPGAEFSRSQGLGNQGARPGETSQRQALQAISKTNDSLCLIFQNQMSPQARQVVDQPELALAWEDESGPLHPQELREAVEAQLERRRQWSPGLNAQAWSDPTQVAETLKESQNGAEPPPDPSLMALDYDPSP